jgi:hypothetical protein
MRRLQEKDKEEAAHSPRTGFNGLYSKCVLERGLWKGDEEKLTFSQNRVVHFWMYIDP